MITCFLFCYNFASNFNLRRYTEDDAGSGDGDDNSQVGRCRLTR